MQNVIGKMVGIFTRHLDAGTFVSPVLFVEEIGQHFGAEEMRAAVAQAGVRFEDVGLDRFRVLKAGAESASARSARFDGLVDRVGRVVEARSASAQASSRFTGGANLPEPSPAVERDAYLDGRMAAAKRRGFERGVADEEGKTAGRAQEVHSPVAGSRVASGPSARPPAPTMTLEEMFDRDTRRHEKERMFARSLTDPASRQVPIDDPVSIGNEARRLRAERPSLGLLEAINEVRTRRGLPARRV